MLALAIQKFLAIRVIKEQEEQEAEHQLQTALSVLEPGSNLDTTTPCDDHCFFHALLRGQLFKPEDIPCKLSISELRMMALTMASSEELEVSALSTGAGFANLGLYTFNTSFLANVLTYLCMLIMITITLQETGGFQ